MTQKSARLYKAVAAVLLGNLAYFGVMPQLPPEMHHRRFELDLGTVVDAWFCLCVYGLIELLLFLTRRRSRFR